MVRQSRVHTPGLPSHPLFAHDALRIDRADLMRLPSYEAVLVKRLSSLLIQGGLLSMGQACLPANLVFGRIG